MENIKDNRVNSEAASKILGLKNARAVARLCKLGKLSPAFKVAEMWQIPRATIEIFLGKCSNEKD